MGTLFAILLAIGFFTALAVLPVFHYWRQLGEDGEFTVEEWGIFRRWVLAGLVVPGVVWVLCNTGFIGPPIFPEITPISAGLGKWWKSFAEVALGAAFIISTYWTGISFAWLLARVYARVGSRRDFFITTGMWSILLGPVALVFLFIDVRLMAGLAMAGWGLVLVHLTLSLQPQKIFKPSYSRAQVKLNFGNYDEAEREVIAELEHCEDDFEGWMMLAELYASHFNDLGGAAQTVRDLCDQPATTPVQLSIALHKLADWHLKYGHDPLCAREALEDIARRLPGTHLERMARQRLNQLPATAAALREQEQGKPMALPSVPDAEPPPPRFLERDLAATQANDCVAALQKNPDDAATRERFARLLAENLGRVDTALEQMRLLLDMSGQSMDRRAEWLMTMALWHGRYRSDSETAQRIYADVVRDFPNTPSAFIAQRRINGLNFQAQFRRRPIVVGGR